MPEIVNGRIDLLRKLRGKIVIPKPEEEEAIPDNEDIVVPGPE